YTTLIAQFLEGYLDLHNGNTDKGIADKGDGNHRIEKYIFK
ncbi:346_t:CDS:1, partial [Dentiscutata erythropus]